MKAIAENTMFVLMILCIISLMFLGISHGAPMWEGRYDVWLWLITGSVVGAIVFMAITGYLNKRNEFK